MFFRSAPQRRIHAGGNKLWFLQLEFPDRWSVTYKLMYGRNDDLFRIDIHSNVMLVWAFVISSTSVQSCASAPLTCISSWKKGFDRAPSLPAASREAQTTHARVSMLDPTRTWIHVTPKYLSSLFQHILQAPTLVLNAGALHFTIFQSTRARYDPVRQNAVKNIFGPPIKS